MTSRIFRVDISERSRDFAAIATEPGLAMLDAQGVNYGLLFKWIGALAAEPELRGDTVSFYVRDQERGRLENVHCVPATKKDLQGPLKAELEEIETGIRRAKPESSTEQLLHKILSRTFKDLTSDLDTSDFNCFFFKYRAGSEPWHLVWCWGYQRKDLEPSNGVVCSNMDCHELFAHKPKTKKICPACKTAPKKKKRGAGILLSPTTLLLLLLLGLGLFLYFNQPKLVVTPGTWDAPRGSRMTFTVTDQRWFFFKEDVSDRAVPQSQDPSVLKFAHGTTGRARSEGRTFATFRFADMQTDITVSVGPPIPPQSLSIEPDPIKVGVDATQRLTVVGKYDDDETLDLTDDAEFEIEDDKIAYISEGRLHGVALGKTKITATYRAEDKNGKEVISEATAKVEVAETDYATLEVSLDPNALAVDQTGELKVVGITKDGGRFDLIGSKKLSLTIEPSDAVLRNDAYLTGKKAGKAKITATIGGLTKAMEFQIGDSLLADGIFDVYPKEVTIVAGTYQDLDVVSGGDGEITWKLQATTATGEPDQTTDGLTIANVIAPDPFLHRLTAYLPGNVKIKFTQGGNEQEISVKVVESNIASIRFEPSLITTYVEESVDLNVVGVTIDGDTVPIAPDQLKILQQPRVGYAEFDRVGMTLFGLEPTPIDDKLVVQFGELPPAEAIVRVDRRLVTDIADDWSVHPPLDVPGIVRVPTGTVGIPGGGIFGNEGLIYDPNRGLVVQSVPPGLVGRVRVGDVIGTIGGRDIRGIRDPGLLGRYITDLGPDGSFGVVGPGGDLVDITMRGVGVTVFQDVQLNYAKESDVTATDFGVELNFQFREAANYRVTDETGAALSEFQSYPAAAAATIVTRIQRVPGRDRYEINVERQSGERVTRFPFTIVLGVKSS